MADTEKQNGNRKKRVPPKAWKPGQSGNPKGRPKKGFAIAERIRAQVSDKDWEEIIKTTVALAKSGDQASRNFLIDRTEGKPTQPTADVSEGWQKFLADVFEDQQE